MAKEAPRTLKMTFGDSPDWKEVVFVPTILMVVSRLISLVFLGEQFMENKEWQRISMMYTVDSFVAAMKLNSFPTLLRPIVHWFLPECRKIREEIKLCRSLITPEVERRLDERRNAKQAETIDGQPFDYPLAELSMAIAATHTTDSAFGFAFFDLVENPQYIQPLRDEVIEVFKEEVKWSKSTIAKLRFMDSFIKESMRYHPHSAFLVHFPRMAKKTITLSDGTVIPKNAYMSVGPTPMGDPSVWPNPDTFDPYRFLKLRNLPGNENRYQAVTTSCDITVFGHGAHSCPGRFFAMNEMKLLLAHLVIEYDWKLPEGQTRVQHEVNGSFNSPNSKQPVLFRKRTPEIDFTALYEE
ncbi:Cytochrome P450 [Neofusicoccum parvum]|nr:Cytochrome P450 [Neofusicoccum parvum]